MESNFSFTEIEREDIAEILSIIAVDGLPQPYDLDVALDAIETTIQASRKNYNSEGS